MVCGCKDGRIVYCVLILNCIWGSIKSRRKGKEVITIFFSTVVIWELVHKGNYYYSHLGHFGNNLKMYSRLK